MAWTGRQQPPPPPPPQLVLLPPPRPRRRCGSPRAVPLPSITTSDSGNHYHDARSDGRRAGRGGGGGGGGARRRRWSLRVPAAASRRSALPSPVQLVAVVRVLERTLCLSSFCPVFLASFCVLCVVKSVRPGLPAGPRTWWVLLRAARGERGRRSLGGITVSAAAGGLGDSAWGGAHGAGAAGSQEEGGGRRMGARRCGRH